MAATSTPTTTAGSMRPSATLLDRGKAAGEVRDEIDATDVILLLGALSRIPGRSGTPGPHAGRRHCRRSPPPLRITLGKPRAALIQEAGSLGGHLAGTRQQVITTHLRQRLA